MPEKPNWTESFQTIAEGRRPFVLRNYDTGYYQGLRNSNILAFLELNHQLLANVEASWLCSPTWELHLCREGSQHWILHTRTETPVGDRGYSYVAWLLPPLLDITQWGAYTLSKFKTVRAIPAYPQFLAEQSNQAIVRLWQWFNKCLVLLYVLWFP